MEYSSTQSNKWARPFFAMWIGQAFSLLGSQLVQFALVWWLTRTTGSATVLATATLVALLPQIFLLPVAGTLVDRWNRRLTMILADSLIALSTLCLAFLFWTNQAEVWTIYIFLFLRAVGGSFHWPAMQASTSLMVPQQHLSRVQGFNQMLNGAMNIIAAPLGALLLEVLPMQGVLMVDVGTALIAVLPLLFIKVPQPQPPTSQAVGGVKATVFQDFRAGIRYVLGWPGLIAITVMATFINLLLTPASSLIPILVTKHFSGMALQLAMLQSAFGIGVILGGGILGVWGGFRRRIYTSLTGLFGLAASSVMLGLLPASAFSIAIPCMLMVGMSLPITNGPLFAALQAVVAPDMQGRVFTLIASVASAMTPIGLLIAGPVADGYGVQAWYLLGGLITFIMALVGLFMPAVRHFEDHRIQSPEESPLAAIPVEIESD